MKKYRQWLASLFMLVTTFANAGQTWPITDFWIVADTSATYDTPLPSPLTVSNVVFQTHWDLINEPNKNFGSVSNRSNNRGWLIWATKTLGYYQASFFPQSNGLHTGVQTAYSTAPAQFFGTYILTDYTGTQVGDIDIFYCSPCNGGGVVTATAASNDGSFWNSNLTILY